MSRKPESPVQGTDILFSVPCDEPGGLVIRNVRELIFTPENLDKFWKQASRYRTIFGKEIPTAKDLLDIFHWVDDSHRIHMNGLFYVIDDFEGVFYITDIDPENDALVHYSFFSGRHKGRLDLVQRMIDYLFQTYNFRRLSAEIPRYARPQTKRFCQTVGFQLEGVKRKSAFYKNDWFDTNLYGLLRDDFYRSEE